jgi:hypothetical protein
MGNTYCTLALGNEHAGYARFLADDLREYGQTLAVLTDRPDFFRRCRNVIARDFPRERFSYHDKRFALLLALEHDNTAIFVDADCAIRFGAPHAAVASALNHDFPPGFHGWHIGSLGLYEEYAQVEALAREWGLHFDRDQVVYQEILFALTREGGREQRFFENWARFAEEAAARGSAGAGEGVCFGIAAQDAMTCHGMRCFDASRLKNYLWHTRLDWRKRRLYHLKFRLKQWWHRPPPTDWSGVEMCGTTPKTRRTAAQPTA